MRVELLTIFFGDKHLEMFFKTMVPSLWKAGNIPDMLEDDVEVVHRIHCPEDEATIMELYQIASKIPVEIMPGTVGNSLSIADHAALADPVKEAIAREVLTVMAPCDHVFGSGLWKTIQQVNPGDYMVCGHPRIESERGLAPMQNFLNSNHDRDNRKFVRFCMEQVQHPMVEHGKKTQEPYWHTFNRQDHWETHFAEPPPLAFWGQPYMLAAWTGYILFSPWEVIDHEMVEHCRQAGKLKWVDDSRQFFWAEFTEHDQYNPKLRQTLKCGFRYECMKQLQEHPLRWYFE